MVKMVCGTIESQMHKNYIFCFLLNHILVCCAAAFAPINTLSCVYLTHYLLPARHTPPHSHNHWWPHNSTNPHLMVVY